MQVEVDAQRREIAAAKAVLRQTAKPTKYSVRALSLMTPGYGAMIGATRHVLGYRYHGA